MPSANGYRLMTTATSLRSLGSYRMLQHGGGIPGFATMQAYFPQASLSVVVFTNTDAADLDRRALDISRAAPGLPLQ